MIFESTLLLLGGHISEFCTTLFIRVNIYRESVYINRLFRAFDGFSIDVVAFFYSYLKRRKQNVTINNTHSVFQILLPGVPQGLILWPLLFNIFISDLYF